MRSYTGDFCSPIAAMDLGKRTFEFLSKIFKEIKTSKSGWSGFRSPVTANLRQDERATVNINPY
jgi:hypothetical protein